MEEGYLNTKHLPAVWVNQRVQQAFFTTARQQPKRAKILSEERIGGSVWGSIEHEGEAQLSDIDTFVPLISGEAKRLPLNGFAILPWREVNSRRQDDELNKAMRPDCTYYAVTAKQLSAVFPYASQNILTLRQWMQRMPATVSEINKTSKWTTPFVHYRDLQKCIDLHNILVMPSVKTGKYEITSDNIDSIAVSECTKDDEYGAWLIVGPGENEGDDDEVWTTYPGPLTQGLPDKWDGQLMSLLPTPHFDVQQGASGAVGWDIADIPEYTVKGR